MKFKLLAVVIAMSAVSHSTFAAIADPDFGQGEAFFSIWDPNTQNSYVQDLGVNFDTLRANLTNSSYSLSYSIDASIYGSAFGSSNPADLIWNVSVAERIDPDFANFENYGIIGTNKNFFRLNSAALGQAIEKHGQMATAQRTAIGGAALDGTIADNFSYWGTIDNGGYAGDCGLWCFNWGGSPGDNTAAIGESMSFWYQQADVFTKDNVSVTEAAGDWLFDGQKIAYAAPVSQVPVPAAIWLMGSGLVGLVGIARRKKTIA